MNLIEAWKLSKEIPKEKRDYHWTFENFDSLAAFVASITEEAALGEWGPKIVRKRVFTDACLVYIEAPGDSYSFVHPRRYASEGILEPGKYKVTVEWEE